MKVIDDNTRIEMTGFPPGLLPRNLNGRKPLCVSDRVFDDDMPLIPKSDWADRIRYMDANKLWIGDRVKLAGGDDANAHSQNGLRYCWAYSLAQAVEAAMIKAGLPFHLLAPESLGEDVNWKNAGNYLDSAIQYAAEHGIARRIYCPQHVINKSRFDPQWETDRASFVPLEWWDLYGGGKTWQRTVTALLDGYGCYVGLDWWSHVVFYDRLVLDGNRVGVHTPNSHGLGRDVVLFGNRAVPSMDSYVIRSTTFQRIAA